MRAPRRRSSIAQPGVQLRNPKNGGLTLYISLLVALLAIAAITSFGTAYYLFTTRWETQALPLVLDVQADRDIQVVAPRHIRNLTTTELHHQFVNNCSHEKFLSYLPHSGFHNQRIAFENALVLARILNRTLLVPPIRLSHTPLHYDKYNRLRQFLAAGKNKLHYCTEMAGDMSTLPECLEYLDWTNISWDWLVDLSSIKAEQRLLQRWNMTDAWIHEQLQISDSDIVTLRDTDLYQYRFVDSTSVSHANLKYTQLVHIPTLALSSKRLLQIGTLFGSSRLRLRRAENVRIREGIRRSMAFTEPTLVNAADAIARALGGAYLGAHIRIGDGSFKSNRDANARLVWWKLVHKVLNLSVEDTLDLEKRLRGNRSSMFSRPPQIEDDYAARRVPHPPLAPLPDIASPLDVSCRGIKHTSPRLRPLNTPVFISTDAMDPLGDVTISLFLRTFPCTFFLSDFPSETAPLTKMRNGEDGVDLKSFLVPFLDAMVVGKAWAVVGTEGSTFSRFVHDILWRTYHGWDIVQRG